MDLQLSGKTALITGASKGIGRAAAERLAAEGCNVNLVARTATDLAAAKAAIAQRSKVQIDTVAVDLSHGSAVERLAKDFPVIDILVNNAGAIPGGQLLDVDEETWRKAWDLKVFGYINMCRAYYALMKKTGSGVIINVTGNAAQTHDPEYICGVAGNAALTAFSQSLGSVSVRDGIRVISLNPGPVETERLVNLMKNKAKDRTGSAASAHSIPTTAKSHSNTGKPPASDFTSRQIALISNVGPSVMSQITNNIDVAEVDHGNAAAAAAATPSANCASSLRSKAINETTSAPELIRKSIFDQLRCLAVAFYGLGGYFKVNNELQGALEAAAGR